MASLRAVVGITVAVSSARSQSPANPFCGFDHERNVVSVSLVCVNGVIDDILFANYGTPSGACPAFVVNSSCNWATSMADAQKCCLNKTQCTWTEDSSNDPCPETVKSLAIVAHCSEGPGGYQPNYVPACSTTDGFPPCPLPTWDPVWPVNRSTICQPGNTPGFLDAVAAARWGLVSLDWSIASGVWYKGNVSNATGAATLVEQCRHIKAVDPSTKCFVYRNTELALAWMEPQRAVMYDPAGDFSSYFLQYQPGNPGNKTPGTIYNEACGFEQLDQYFWNYSNPDCVEYVLGVSEQGSLGTSSPYVDGTFLDDSQAIPQEHPDAPSNMGILPSELIVLQNDTHAFVNKAIAALASTGHYVWQGFNNNPGGDPDAVGPAPTASSCLGYMSMVCAPSWQAVPYTMQWPGAQADKLPALAAFLIGRGPYAYLGYGWNGGPLPDWDPIWDAYDVGVPTSLCTLGAAGVFSRLWSKGTVQLDCNSWTATLDF